MHELRNDFIILYTVQYRHLVCFNTPPFLKSEGLVIMGMKWKFGRSPTKQEDTTERGNVKIFKLNIELSNVRTHPKVFEMEVPDCTTLRTPTSIIPEC